MNNYIKNDISATDIKDLCSKYKIDAISSSIILRRNLNNKNKLKYILFNDDINVHSPFYFTSIVAGLKRFSEAINNKESIYCFGDRDADGVTSLAIMDDYLTKKNITHYLSLPQGDEPYGLSLKAVEEAKEKNCTLLITVDCGTSSINEIQEAKKKGIDVIVLDHHLGDENVRKLSQAVSLINPSVDSSYPFKHLSAAAVTYKFIYAHEFYLSDCYDKEYVLLTSEYSPTGKSVVLSLACIKNLIITKKIVEEWKADGLNIQEDSEILKTINKSKSVCVFSKDETLKALKSAFVNFDKPNIFIDLKDRIQRYFPMFNNKTLGSISTSILYHLFSSSPSSKSLDTFIYLFTKCLIKNIKNIEEIVDKNLDFVAISTVSDIMSIEDENITLLRSGLKLLNNKPHNSLLPFISQKSVALKPISSTDISFYITPVINAAGRLGKPTVALDTLTAKDKDRSDIISRSLFALNDERKRITNNTWKIIEGECKKSFLINNEKLVFVAHQNIDRGFTGLLSSKIQSMYNVPSVVISISDDIYTGSIRTPEDINALELLSKFSSHFISYGAHDRAGGFSFKKDNYSSLKKEFSQYVKDNVNIKKDQDIYIDASLPSDYLKNDIINIVDMFSPYGCGNKELIFSITDLQIKNISLFYAGEKLSTRISFITKTSHSVFNAVGWDLGSKVQNVLSEGDFVNIVTKIEKNYFKGNVLIQLNLIDIIKAQ